MIIIMVVLKPEESQWGQISSEVSLKKIFLHYIDTFTKFSAPYWLNIKKNLFWNRKSMKITIRLFKFFDPIVTGGARGDFENLPVTSNRKTWLLCSASMAVLYHLSFKYGTSLCGLATELLKFTYERPKQTFFN